MITNEPNYAVVASGATPFLLGRYLTLEAAKRAMGNRPDIWLVYKLVDKIDDKEYCGDFGRCNCLEGHCDKGLRN